MPIHIVRGFIVAGVIIAVATLLTIFQVDVRAQIASAVNAALTSTQGARL